MQLWLVINLWYLGTVTAGLASRNTVTAGLPSRNTAKSKTNHRQTKKDPEDKGVAKINDDNVNLNKAMITIEKYHGYYSSVYFYLHFLNYVYKYFF